MIESVIWKINSHHLVSIKFYTDVSHVWYRRNVLLSEKKETYWFVKEFQLVFNTLLTRPSFPPWNPPLWLSTKMECLIKARESFWIQLTRNFPSFFNNAVHQNGGGDSDAPALLGPLSRHAASRGESWHGLIKTWKKPDATTAVLNNWEY